MHHRDYDREKIPIFSRESQKLFKPNYDDNLYRNTREVIVERAKYFKHILCTTCGWKECVEGKNKNEEMSKFQIEAVKCKIKCLMYAYDFAAQHMPFKTWQECCQMVIDKKERESWIHSNFPENSRTIMDYNVEYRMREKFSRCYYRNKKHLPPILFDNPDMVHGMMDFFREKQHEGMTAEKIKNFIHKKLIPKMVMREKFAFSSVEGPDARATLTAIDDDNDDDDSDYEYNPENASNNNSKDKVLSFDGKLMLFSSFI